MCNYKAIVSDLDGTLFDADSRITPRTAAAPPPPPPARGAGRRGPRPV